MSEYNSYPLWEAKEDGLSNFAAYELNIPFPLAQKIEDWGDQFEATFVPDDPASSGFENANDRERFIEAGKSLLQELEMALGEGYELEYRMLGGERLKAQS
ncbi:hypothetical protein [Aestuariispira ectoiniformans]|uniref:hypothetical protein n=1 Tax=Aestuariispira ectoiniformans TaxID=2775080 RepID=UPI00223AFFF5|nr:hypothetical protein [Aestuariispira ectoiniformans]